MGRGVSYGGGQSSLGYLFGSDEGPNTEAASSAANKDSPRVDASDLPSVQGPSPPQNFKAEEASIGTDLPAGKLSSNPNNYHRSEGQNTGNFITDRPSTKVHSAPGGGSSLGYLFGGAGDN